MRVRYYTQKKPPLSQSGRDTPYAFIKQINLIKQRPMKKLTTVEKKTMTTEEIANHELAYKEWQAQQAQSNQLLDKPTNNSKLDLFKKPVNSKPQFTDRVKILSFSAGFTTKKDGITPVGPNASDIRIRMQLSNGMVRSFSGYRNSLFFAGLPLLPLDGLDAVVTFQEQDNGNEPSVVGVRYDEIQQKGRILAASKQALSLVGNDE